MERGRSAAAVALGVNSPRHLSAGSLPLPGPQSLSLMVHWGAPNCPGCREGEGCWRAALLRWSPEVQGPGQVRPNPSCPAAGALDPGLVTAGPLSGLAARARALSRALLGGGVGRGSGGVGPLTSWGRCRAASPRTLSLSCSAAVKFTPPKGPGCVDKESRNANLLREA